ncbi:MAG: endonuclease III [Deltaproteobacteria bacterium]|nr:endonuclease III [Deltaproteobacteria bacterium]
MLSQHPLKKATHATVENVSALSQRLAERWPDVRVELDHRNAYELLVATILAAQNTDKNINTITPALFAKYPDVTALAKAKQGELEQLIFRSGFYRNKATNLIAMATKVVADHGGEIPNTMEGLCALPGVARKTANVVLGNTMNIAVGIVVDTHISRVAPRLGLTAQHDPVKIEHELMALVPQDQWIAWGNRMIHHGRYLCLAKQPLCDQCPLAPLCPSAFADVMPAKPTPTPRAKSVEPTPAGKAKLAKANGKAKPDVKPKLNAAKAARAARAGA